MDMNQTRTETVEKFAYSPQEEITIIFFHGNKHSHDAFVSAKKYQILFTKNQLHQSVAVRMGKN